MECTSPTWRNYDNQHLLEDCSPKLEYQAWADEENAVLASSGSSERLVWNAATASFILREVTEEE